MPVEFNEGQPRNPGNPDQEPRALRVAKVIDELTRATRFLADLEDSRHFPDAKDDTTQVRYDSADGKKQVVIWRNYLHSAANSKSNFPEAFKEHEQVIPMNYQSVEEKNDPHHTTVISVESVWLSLDKDNPRVYQVRNERGTHYPFPYFDMDFISKGFTGREKVEERADLLPHIMESVSGTNYVLS